MVVLTNGQIRIRLVCVHLHLAMYILRPLAVIQREVLLSELEILI